MRELRAKRKEEDRLIKKKMKASRKINDTFEDKIFYSVINIILTILLLIIAVPILYILACMKIKMKEDDNYGVKHCSYGNNK